MQETQVGSLDWEDPLEEEMATLSSIPLDSPVRTEDPLRLQSLGSHIVGQDWHAVRGTLDLQTVVASPKIPLPRILKALTVWNK